ncbi:hypothetical protein [Streptomyces fumanus]|nr:hypothetical protein [Streptomyces fumanus]
MLADTGVSYAALGLFSTSEEELPDSPDGISRHELAEGAAQCAFTLAAVPTDHAASDTDVVAQGIVAALSRDPYNDVRWLDLPCGPAVACITWRQYGAGPQATESDEDAELVTAQLQIHIPFPTGPFTAVFTVLTAYVDHWQRFCEMTEAILQTVSFVDPADGEDSEPSMSPTVIGP